MPTVINNPSSLALLTVEIGTRSSCMKSCTRSRFSEEKKELSETMKGSFSPNWTLFRRLLISFATNISVRWLVGLVAAAARPGSSPEVEPVRLTGCETAGWRGGKAPRRGDTRAGDTERRNSRLAIACKCMSAHFLPTSRLTARRVRRTELQPR